MSPALVELSWTVEARKEKWKFDGLWRAKWRKEERIFQKKEGTGAKLQDVFGKYLANCGYERYTAMAVWHSEVVWKEMKMEKWLKARLKKDIFYDMSRNTGIF